MREEPHKNMAPSITIDRKYFTVSLDISHSMDEQKCVETEYDDIMQRRGEARKGNGVGAHIRNI